MRSDNSMSFHFQPHEWQVLLDGKNRPTLITRPPRCSTLLVKRVNKLPNAASENERERCRFLSKPLEVQILNADHPIAGSYLCGELVEHIISQTGNPGMKPCELSAGFLPVF